MIELSVITCLCHRMVRDFSNNNDVKQTRKLIQILTQEFANSQNPHSRKGGLIGLAATAIALGKVCSFINHMNFHGI